MDAAAVINESCIIILVVHVLDYMFVGPPFTVELINNSPRIQGDTVSIDFNATYPLLSATCYLGREFVEDCEFNVWDYTVCDY